MKKNLIFAILFIIFIVAISGCESNKIKSSYDAISAVKDSYCFEDEIAHDLGFERYYSPKFSSENAEQKEDGSWYVVMKGSMSGYKMIVGKYREIKKDFILTANVSKDGEVSNFKAMI